MKKIYICIWLLSVFMSCILYSSIMSAGKTIEKWDDDDIEFDIGKLTIKSNSYTFMLALDQKENIDSLSKNLDAHLKKDEWGSCPDLKGLVCADTTCEFCKSVSKNIEQNVLTLFCTQSNQEKLKNLPGILMAAQISVDAQDSKKNIKQLTSVLEIHTSQKRNSLKQNDEDFTWTEWSSSEDEEITEFSSAL